MKKVEIYIAVMIPPGAESKVTIDWDRDEKELRKRCLKCRKFTDHLRIETLKVEVEV